MVQLRKKNKASNNSTGGQISLPFLRIPKKLPPKVTQQDVELYIDAHKLAHQQLVSENFGDDVVERDNQVNPKVIVFGRYEIETWFMSPFSQEYARFPKLFFCEFCLVFVKSQRLLDWHLAKCQCRHPPGDEVYRCDDLSVFEIEGDKSQIYCKHLCLLSKLFLECKGSFAEADLFKFYVVTRNDAYGCHFVGYFSKMRGNEWYNLACLMILPPYQRQGYGRFVIDFSYLLSRTEGVIGTPERPFTEFGRITYHSYWKSVVLEYLDTHRGSKFIKISNITQETGIAGEDVAETLMLLGFLRKNLATRAGRRLANKIVVSVDWSMVDVHMAKLRQSSRIPLDPGLLRKSPAEQVKEDKTEDRSLGKAVSEDFIQLQEATHPESPVPEAAPEKDPEVTPVVNGRRRARRKRSRSAQEEIPKVVPVVNGRSRARRSRSVQELETQEVVPVVDRRRMHRGRRSRSTQEVVPARNERRSMRSELKSAAKEAPFGRRARKPKKQQQCPCCL